MPTVRDSKICEARSTVGFGIVAFSRRPVKGASAASGGGWIAHTRKTASGSKSKNM